MRSLGRLLVECWYGEADLDEISRYALGLVEAETDLPPEIYELLNPGSTDTVENLERVAKYYGNPFDLKKPYYQKEAVLILLEKLRQLISGDLSHSEFNESIRFLSNNLPLCKQANWLGELYNDFDMFGEYWTNTTELDRKLHLRVIEVEDWLNNV